jgi:hypothetical protein
MQTPTNFPLVSPAEETILLGPLAIRFLLTGDNSLGSVAMFELSVPGGQRLQAPRTAMITTKKRYMGSTE